MLINVCTELRAVESQAFRKTWILRHFLISRCGNWMIRMVNTELSPAISFFFCRGSRLSREISGVPGTVCSRCWYCFPFLVFRTPYDAYLFISSGILELQPTFLRSSNCSLISLALSHARTHTHTRARARACARMDLRTLKGVSIHSFIILSPALGVSMYFFCWTPTYLGLLFRLFEKENLMG